MEGNLQAKVNRLIEIINREVVCLENFMTLLTKEQQLLAENNIQSLQNSVGEQEKAILEAEKLEKERIKLTDQIASNLKLNKEETNLSRLIQLLEESYSTQLKELQKTLLHLYQKVERQRRKNEFLIRQSMGMVDRNMKFILGVEATAPTYPRPNGKKAQAYGRKVVDRLG